VEALRHAAIAIGSNLNLRWVSSEDIEAYGAEHLLSGVNGIVVPGGFGFRGVDGKIAAIQYARENEVPFLGLCLGMQCAVIEWAQHVAKLEDAHSVEFAPNATNPVINLLPEQQDVVDLGGTMRLGLFPCRLAPNTLAFSLYQEEVIYERHRHRYEFNNAYRNLFLETGYTISGTSPDGRLVEMIELPQHPFFIATQFHPEFSSRPSTPHPLFEGFIQAAAHQANGEEPIRRNIDSKALATQGASERASAVATLEAVNSAEALADRSSAELPPKGNADRSTSIKQSPAEVS
jgi:CTP synthase